MTHSRIPTPENANGSHALIKDSFAPGTKASKAILAYARICGVGEITMPLGSGYDQFERGMIEGRRSALIDLMNMAGIDPLTAFKPTPEKGD